MTDLRQAAQQAEPCIGKDPRCPCQDGDACHYKDCGNTKAQPEPVSMRMPKVGDKVICLEDESLGEVVSLTAGGSPDIAFDDGSRGTYLLREFAELFGYVTPPAAQRKPLTDDELEQIFRESSGYGGDDFQAFARAIEAAHGIKEGT